MSKTISDNVQASRVRDDYVNWLVSGWLERAGAKETASFMQDMSEEEQAEYRAVSREVYGHD